MQITINGCAALRRLFFSTLPTLYSMSRESQAHPGQRNMEEALKKDLADVKTGLLMKTSHGRDTDILK